MGPVPETVSLGFDRAAKNLVANQFVRGNPVGLFLLDPIISSASHPMLGLPDVVATICALLATSLPKSCTHKWFPSLMILLVQ